ncbi:hypothetical protein I7I53_11522 [Histoplasma capsulatum var. duboisii H88]|uniref:Uncharacterized protein n=1 Tax=Ajellomyces capsulatus (strain H88) TaxID=544711 RepID=A0A8A1LAN7_AJEC8|nr:hypothetical protein I7I53_11522 [Histoplasma capsulatum var. duboisii H88]
MNKNNLSKHIHYNDGQFLMKRHISSQKENNSCKGEAFQIQEEEYALSIDICQRWNREDEEP